MSLVFHALLYPLTLVVRFVDAMARRYFQLRRKQTGEGSSP